MAPIKVSNKPRTVGIPEELPDQQQRDYRKGDSRFVTVLGSIMILTLAVSFISGLNKVKNQPAPSHEVAFSLPIIITDEADGAVKLSDAKTGDEIWVYGSGEGAFARAAMRALAFSRLRQGAGPDQPMLLQRTTTGAIILFDPVTENAIPVNAFGESNVQQFAIVLDHKKSQMEQLIK
ncbi:MAG: photosynthetic complex assembly protein PuhC [Pseudomonadota bacterium]